MALRKTGATKVVANNILFYKGWYLHRSATQSGYSWVLYKRYANGKLIDKTYESVSLLDIKKFVENPPKSSTRNLPDWF
jgi:hypothetical protein